MMFLADVTVDPSSIWGAAGVLASGIGGGISLAAKIYVTYRKERDDLDRKQKEDHLLREEKLVVRADEREKLAQSYYKDIIDKFVKIAETSVSIQVALAGKIETIGKNIDGFHSKLDGILMDRKSNHSSREKT